MKRLISLFLLVFYTVFLLSGCAVHIHMDQPSENTQSGNASIFDFIFNNSLFKTPMYKSRATILISNTATAKSPAISSSDLSATTSLAKTYAAILNTSKIQNKIKEEYPNIEYELTLEPINETEICAVIATSEHPEKLEDICNLAVSLLCEEVSLIVEGSSCKVIDNATPAQLVGTN